MHRIKQFWYKLTDPLEFIRLKLAVVGVILIIGMMLDGR